MGQEKELENEISGALDYISYEQMTGSKYGKPVDWWALGIMTYELIVG